jgi:hypothetical protein
MKKIGYLETGYEVEILEKLPTGGHLVRNTYNVFVYNTSTNTYSINVDEEYQSMDSGDPYFTKHTIYDTPIFPKLNDEYTKTYNQLNDLQKKVKEEANNLHKLKLESKSYTDLESWKIDLSKFKANKLYCFVTSMPMPISFDYHKGVKFIFERTYSSSSKNTITSDLIKLGNSDAYTHYDIDKEYGILFDETEINNLILSRIDKKINDELANSRNLDYQFKQLLPKVDPIYLSDFAKSYIKDYEEKANKIRLDELLKQKDNIDEQIKKLIIT